jgi:hypothetical protein
MIKIQCPFCKENIEITQSEMAKHGYKLFEDHKADCFKKMCPNFGELMAKVFDK